jgi:hypothetical protein
MLKLSKKTTKLKDPEYMEMLTYNGGDIQSYGYIVYRKEVNLEGGKTLTLPGPVRDRATVIVNERVKTVVTRDGEEASPKVSLPGQSDESRLDIIVENLGRVNYTLPSKKYVLNTQRKGLSGTVKLDNEDLKDWTVVGIDFDDDYIEELSKTSSWSKISPAETDINVPSLFKATLEMDEAPAADYFVVMDGWGKGVVIVNGFNLGRYWAVGPTKTLYLPAPLLKKGVNQIIIFEEEKAGRSFTLGVEPCLGSPEPRL